MERKKYSDFFKIITNDPYRIMFVTKSLCHLYTNSPYSYENEREMNLVYHGLFANWGKDPL